MLIALVLVRNPLASSRREAWREKLFAKFDKIRVFADMIEEAAAVLCGHHDPAHAPANIKCVVAHIPMHIPPNG